MYTSERRPVKRLAKLSWRAPGTGALCTAETDEPISGYRITAKTFLVI